MGELGTSKKFAPLLAESILEKFPGFVRHLPTVDRFTPRQFCISEDIRVSFLWTTLWKVSPARIANHGAATATEKWQIENARQPVSRVLSAPLTGRDDHSSGTHLTMRLTRPTRAAGRERPCDHHGIEARTVAAAPIRSCSRWGLPCRPCCQGRGALLPHRFALARGTGLLTRTGLARAVCFLWHCPWGRPRRPLAGTVFPWSPDFPPPTGIAPPAAAVQLSGDADVRLRDQVESSVRAACARRRRVITAAMSAQRIQRRAGVQPRVMMPPPRTRSPQ